MKLYNLANITHNNALQRSSSDDNYKMLLMLMLLLLLLSKLPGSAELTGRLFGRPFRHCNRLCNAVIEQICTAFNNILGYFGVSARYTMLMLHRQRYNRVNLDQSANMLNVNFTSCDCIVYVYCMHNTFSYVVVLCLLCLPHLFALCWTLHVSEFFLLENLLLYLPLNGSVDFLVNRCSMLLYTVSQKTLTFEFFK